MSGKNITLAAIGVGVGLTLIILACALDGVYYPLFTLIPLILMPLPGLCISSGAADDPGYGNPDGIAYIHWASFGAFFVAVFLSSAFALVAVFFHLAVISGRALAFSIAGSLVVLGTGVAVAMPAQNLSCPGSDCCGRRGTGGVGGEKLLF